MADNERADYEAALLALPAHDFEVKVVGFHADTNLKKIFDDVGEEVEEVSRA